MVASAEEKENKKWATVPLLNNLMSNQGFNALTYEYLITDKRISKYDYETHILVHSTSFCVYGSEN